ncbi:hypothetical protein HY989_05320 [Candidatus Micrarchaeota archaeon]|nr:hypothetical protein [Candidatus Micrarchaeota archaeon]
MLKKDFIDKNENALKTIELLKWKEIIPDSIILLKSPWPVKRANAIRALRNTQSIEAIPHLVAMLGDQKCSDELEDALLKFDFHKTIPPIFEALNSYRENYDTLAFLGTSGPRFLTKNRLIYGALDFLGKYRPRILKNYGRFSQNQPEYVALLHINPFTHPKSFIKLYGEAQKKPRKSPEYWKLEAKQLMAMERRLK